MHVALWVVVKSIHGLSSQNDMPMPLFILLGAIPWLFTRKTLGNSSNTISANKGLLIFRQIRPIDIVLSMVFAELGVIAIVLIGVLLIFWWVNIHWYIHDFLYWLINLASYVCFILGASISLAIAGFFFKFINKFMTVIMRAFYLLSGVFFNAQMIPVAMRKYFFYNPVFQIIEITRESFTQTPSHSVLVDPIYLFKCGIISLTIGLGLYTTMRNRIMTEITQR